MNVVTLVGRLATDPELRYTRQGTAVVNFKLAVERPFTNQNGERETDFIPVTVWRSRAESCAENLVKGQRCGVRGRLQVRSYEDARGERRYWTYVEADYVEFMDKPSGYRRDEVPASVGSDQKQGDIPF